MGRLHGLDALRGIAAIIVVLFHMGWFPAGDLAVDLFFVISGFVMARTYEARMAEGLTTIRFYKIRFKRLWPVFAIGVALGVAQFLSVGADTARTLVSAAALLLFLPSPMPIGRHQFNPNGPGWSLFLELAANTLHAAVLSKLSNRSLITLWVLSAAIFAGSTLYFGYRIAGSQAWMLPLSLARCLASYIAGILIFRFGAKIDIRPGIAVATLPLLILFIGSLPVVWPSLIFVFAICPVLVISAADPKASLPLAGALGAISYPLYATHMPVLNEIGGTEGLVACLSLAGAVAAFEKWLKSGVPRNQVPRSSTSP